MDVAMSVGRYRRGRGYVYRGRGSVCRKDMRECADVCVER